MMRSDNHAALHDAIARFQDEVRRLALRAVQVVLGQELDRKQAKRQRTRRGARVPDRKDTAAVPAATSTREPAPASALAPAVAATTLEPAAPSAGEPAATASALEPAAAGAPAGERKRGPWTRDAVVSELATWMLSGTAIDAAFVARYGPPGLVAATRRLFGRFDAALNVAALHVSKLYPDGPPTKPTPTWAPRRDRSRR